MKLIDICECALNKVVRRRYDDEVDEIEKLNKGGQNKDGNVKG